MNNLLFSNAADFKGLATIDIDWLFNEFVFQVAALVEIDVAFVAIRLACFIWETFMNRVTLTLASFLAYFALSGMLAPIGILVQPSAAALGVSAGEMVRTLGFFSTGTLAGSLAAVSCCPV